MADAAPWIDPEYVAMGARLRAHGLSSLSPVNSPLADCRSMLGRIGAFLNKGSIALEQERDVSVPGPHGAIPCRLYLPDGIERPPLIVYAHGGSFAIGTLSAWDGMLRDLVRQSGVAVLSVDCHLAPEHRFPVAYDEMRAVVRFAASQGEKLEVDPSRLAAGGDSAGANLALDVALGLRDDGDSPLSFLLLIYGVYSTDIDSDAWRAFGTGAYGLSCTQMRWIYQNYLSNPNQLSAMHLPSKGSAVKSAPGTYAVLLRSRLTAEIPIGRRGRLCVRPGYYIYVGSAFGPGGVRTRVDRHFRKEKKNHWHIDFLGEVTDPVGAWYRHGSDQFEHKWAQALERLKAVSCIAGFGCSDCKCKGHLFVASKQPDHDEMARIFGKSAEWRSVAHPPNKTRSCRP